MRFNQRSDWHPTGKDIVLLNLGINGSNFRVPNNFEQEENRQRQRQELRDHSQSVSWQRVWTANTATNVAYFRRHTHAGLFGSESDTPIFAAQDRTHTRQGIIASLSKQWGSHVFKTGVETAREKSREVGHSRWLGYVGRVGLVAKGVSYALVAALAIAVAAGVGGRATGREGALEVVADEV